MIKVLILEDEAPARRKFKRFIEELEQPVTVIAELGTITEAASFLKTTTDIDLILSDIELQDGNVFEVYSNISISCPIIFTTAYNEFLMDAFETNGIEYLLKPFSKERFNKAWNKFLLLRNNSNTNDHILHHLNHFIKDYQPETQTYKNRFSITSHSVTYFLNTTDILFFSAEEGVVFALDHFGKKHLLNQATLKEIEAVIDPYLFFRINRSELVNKNFIKHIRRYNKNTLAITLNSFDRHLITSQNTTSLFKEWIEK